MTKGEIVLVKSSGGEPLARIVCGEYENGVLICSEGEFTSWQDDDIEPLMVRCQWEHVYKYDKKLFQELREIAYNEECEEAKLNQLWKLANPYYERI